MSSLQTNNVLKKELSTGVIIAISITALVVFALFVWFVYWLVNKRRKHHKEQDSLMDTIMKQQMEQRNIRDLRAYQTIKK